MDVGGVSAMIIAGELVSEVSGGLIAVRNPATDALISEVPNGGLAETRAAIEGADRALKPWRSTPAPARAAILRAWADKITAERERLALILTAEQGKPLREARTEIQNAATYVRNAAEEATRVLGQIVPSPAADKRTLVMRQPIGVVGAITPWNFPSVITARKVAPALAVGCTVVLKPARLTPLSALALAELAIEAGLPPGVLSVVTGDSDLIATALLDDPRVRMISFTGSTEVGRTLIAKSARNVTKLTLELGGHAPLIVFDDADLQAAVDGTVAAKFRNGGQTCICPNRVIVHEDILDAFRDALAERMSQFTVGPGDDELVDIGPLINDEAILKVERHVDDAARRGASVVLGGRRADRKPGLADHFYLPTLLEQVSPSALIASEETFGPVIPLSTFRSDREGIDAANATPYGLAAYFFTQSAARLIRVAEELEFGIIGANDGAVSHPFAPLGGMKWSGLGREGGSWGTAEYLEDKYVSIGGIAGDG